MRALVMLAVTTAVCAGRADTPLPPPAVVSAMSPNGHMRVISDPRAGTRVEDVKRNKVLWSIPGWHRSLFIADDGNHLVTQYDGLNLVPVDFNDDLVLLTFWRDGKKIRDVRIRDFVPDHHLLEPTASHYNWGTVEGIDGRGLLKVKRADGKVFLFNVSTGKATEA